VTRYLYDGDDLLMEVDNAGNPVREYTYYPGVDQPHSVRSWPNGGATYYYATDAVGHVTGLLNGSGQVVNRYKYTPWGPVVSAQEAWCSRWATWRARTIPRPASTMSAPAGTTRTWGRS
jgi:hypothetical protein